MKTANLIFRKEEGTMHVCLLCSPQNALHTSCNATLMSGFLERSFVIGVEAAFFHVMGSNILLTCLLVAKKGDNLVELSLVNE
jgi:hypothetical protein